MILQFYWMQDLSSIGGAWYHGGGRVRSPGGGLAHTDVLPLTLAAMWFGQPRPPRPCRGVIKRSVLPPFAGPADSFDWVIPSQCVSIEKIAQSSFREHPLTGACDRQRVLDLSVWSVLTASGGQFLVVILFEPGPQTRYLRPGVSPAGRPAPRLRLPARPAAFLSDSIKMPAWLLVPCARSAV